MNIRVTRTFPQNYDGDLLVCFVRQTEGGGQPLCEHAMVEKHLKAAFSRGDFVGKDEQILLCYPIENADLCLPKRILGVGLGKEAIEAETFRKAGGIIVNTAKKTKTREIMIILPECDLPVSVLSQCLTEGLMLGNYSFDKYKTKKNDDDSPQTSVEAITFSCAKDREARQGVKTGAINSEAVIRARDMANEPGSSMTASDFVALSLDLHKKYGLKREVFGKTDLQKMKMGGLLAVNRGSAQPPALVVLEYRTGCKVPTLLLVGKGLTFDSGGISLKPGTGMQDMKYDMCGGAAVMAVMQAIGSAQPKNIDVIAIVPATDNMPGGPALKPGDIVRLYNGKTVEVVNTDAEGRLILADALAYGVKHYQPDAVIDLATLTGAVIVGLGHHTAGLMGNDDALAAKLEQAGALSGEPVWRLPLGKQYRKQIDSSVADLKNVGDKGAGTITAGAFLQEFVGEAKWAHLDIAGTAWDFTEKSYIPKGPSGYGVRLILETIRNW